MNRQFHRWMDGLFGDTAKGLEAACVSALAFSVGSLFPLICAVFCHSLYNSSWVAGWGFQLGSHLNWRHWSLLCVLFYCERVSKSAVGRMGCLRNKLWLA
ncbi:hypothetical protein SUGI_0432470 [Cryptomeria japonica]|nr:hypothetical protein SUGI_0432470 [Cryptomeria japonica]